MRIIQLSTYDMSGGASRATFRLHRGLREMGEDCRMIVRQKDSHDDFVLPCLPQTSAAEDHHDFFLSKVIQGQYIDAHRTDISNTLFSLPYPGLDLSVLPLIQGADIINLHWVARYQSPVSLRRLFSLDVPVVWTLHDQWAFTGGCHYSAGCEKYRDDCSGCPQLENDAFNLPAAILKDKLALLRDADLTIVTPSRWMADCARQSKLFRDQRIEVIPNSLETDLYAPMARPSAREKLGFDKKMVTLLFGGEDGNEKRKGFKELMSAIQYCLQDVRFQGLVEAGQFTLTCFGHPNSQIESLGIPVVALGYLESEEDIRDAYAGADIFVLPSLEDNLPNTILEAMSCGTPVVAFDTGGMPDMVQHGVNGYLVSIGNPKELGNALLSLIFDSERRKAMGEASRKRVEAEYPLDVQAHNYLRLYKELTQKKDASKHTHSVVCEAAGWEKISDGKNEKVYSPRENAIGPDFSTIYDAVLFKALREFAPYIHELWEDSEADRKDRYDQNIKLAELLRESEGDRKARLDQINKLNAQIKELNTQINEITQLFGESEADRKATLDQISDLAEMLDKEKADWRTEVARLNEWPGLLKEKEERHLIRSRLVEALQTGIRNMRHEVERAYMRAGAAEKGWRDLESTFVVRQARKLGMIKLSPYQATNTENPQLTTKDKKNLIAVDMTPVLPGGENGGAKIFVIELLKSLQKHAPEDQFLLLTAPWNHEELATLDGSNMSRLRILSGKTKGRKTSAIHYPGLLRRSLSKMSRKLSSFARKGVVPRKRLSSHGVDLLFCPFTAPTYAEPGIPTVSVIYDLQHVDFPQFFSPDEIGVRDVFMKEVKERTDHIVCISKYVKETVLKHLNTDPQRTHAVHVCIQSRLSMPDQKRVEQERFNLGIDSRPYMFYPANFWPHKNHRMLVTAYGMFLARNPEKPLDLVFTGALDDLESELKDAVDRMKMTDRVHFLGFLPQEQLEAVWHGCEFLIFPSLYEGFGIPVLEAMSIGKPVLCSNTTSLPEVAGEAALLFDPRKPWDMVKCMERLTGDAFLQQEMAQMGITRAERFSQRNMISTYKRIFGSALGVPRNLNAEVWGIYEDGWIGEGVRIGAGPGPRNRTLDVRVMAPPWLPSARVKLRLDHKGRLLKKLSLRRGKEITLSQPLPEKAILLTLTVTPTFQPSACGIGEDNRVLGAKCQGCWIVHPDQKKISLLG